MAKSTNGTVPAAVAILDLQLALLREQKALHDWKLADAAVELATMKKVRARAAWTETDAARLEAFDAALARSTQAVASRDTTRLGAAHTALHQAVTALRDALYD
jgi:hypothetical protein